MSCDKTPWPQSKTAQVMLTNKAVVHSNAQPETPDSVVNQIAAMMDENDEPKPAKTKDVKIETSPLKLNGNLPAAKVVDMSSEKVLVDLLSQGYEIL